MGSTNGTVPTNSANCYTTTIMPVPSILSIPSAESSLRVSGNPGLSNNLHENVLYPLNSRTRADRSVIFKELIGR